MLTCRTQWKSSYQSTIKARQLSSSSTKKHLVINAVGIDRPGIVADVTKIVTSNGGNCGESRAQLLGGHFSLMMLVDIPEAGIDGLKRQLESDVGGLSTGCFDAVDPKAIDVNPKIGCKSYVECFICSLLWLHILTLMILHLSSCGTLQTKV
jgi:predicted amino acid-binding ACT domain protein